MKTLEHKVTNVNCKPLVDTLADRLADMKMDTLSKTLAELEGSCYWTHLETANQNKVTQLAKQWLKCKLKF